MPSQLPSAPTRQRFRDLMPHRILEVLLVSSPFDAFILEEDGLLNEQVYLQYRGLSLSAPPRFTHASTGGEAMRLLRSRHFDLVITMTSLADMGVNAFARKIKKRWPERAVVLLGLDRRELFLERRRLDPELVDAVFLWTGDVQVLLAIVKSMEDRRNVDHDVRHGDVRVILMLEDSPRYYSSFLGMLYRELMDQSQSLYFEGTSEAHRRMYMRSRPKVLLATSYEEGRRLLRRYRRNLLAVISDVRLPRDGKLHPQAGLSFVRAARRDHRELPVLLQSSEADNASPAADMGLMFVDKRSPRMLAEIRSFLQTVLGFGDFIFRLPSGKEVGRARDLQSLERGIEQVPEASLLFHVRHNHFSVWLLARSEYRAADILRPVQLDDFDNPQALRDYLVQTLAEVQRTARRGTVSDYQRADFGDEAFVRLGHGALGGKGRGLAFLHQSLSFANPEDFAGLPVRLPKTLVIAADNFERFLDHNDLRDFAYSCEDDDELARTFLEAELPPEVKHELPVIAQHLTGPVAVRSSSVLEDSMHQPFAGIYSTFMVAEQAGDPGHLRALAAAIKLIYASTFSRNARSYLDRTGYRIEEERMAVILQRVIGRRHGDRYYPSFSGVAQSHNFYPVGPQRPEDGVVYLALGLGRTIVDGGKAMRFCPRHPRVRTPVQGPEELLDQSQRGFFALDLATPCCDPSSDLERSVRYLDLRQAEKDGTLAAVGSVYSLEDERIRDDLSLSGPRLVTFNNLLEHRGLPLAEALDKVLTMASEGLGCAAEVEFACELGDWGRPGAKQQRTPSLYLLQVRPFAARRRVPEAMDELLQQNNRLCQASGCLGHGVEDDIRDLVLVDRHSWEPNQNPAIAREIGRLNRRLAKEGRPFVLIGPGRWGSADPWLGIPVEWSQISNVRTLVETVPGDRPVEPSQGMHFFQNLTSLRIGYFYLQQGIADEEEAYSLDWDWLEEQETHHRTHHLRHLRWEKPLTVAIDGRSGRGVISKPAG